MTPIASLRRLIDHAQEAYPHFESDRGQKDIQDAIEATEGIVKLLALLLVTIAPLIGLLSNLEAMRPSPTITNMRETWTLTRAAIAAAIGQEGDK